ncbi:MAG: flagellar biosynthesis protein FlhB [Bdellovibrionaceae bacterium]|nr:flagellar biosynthesis protein FlhB [Pseudobdellovibrionaceae bacterium]
MAEQSDSEKSEEATQTRRDDFRKRGQVAQTRELGTAAVLLFGAMAVYALSRIFVGQMSDMFQGLFGGNLITMIRSGDMLMAGIVAGKTFAILVFPVIGLMLIVSLGSSLIQTGLLQVEDALEPKFERLDPMQGFKRIFSLRSLVEGGKSILKLFIIGWITYMVLKGEAAMIPTMINASVNEILAFMALLVGKLLAIVGFSMLVVAAADYFFNWWDLEKRMMMTKQEVKEEHKSREGDPLIKARIRRIQREVANRRMMDKVREADVIVTNPTHIAVALKYDANLPAPQLVAKGADLVAEKIRAIANEHKIPIVENKPLARAIFKTMKIGQVIPRELYVAVAEVLSYVYKLKRRFSRRNR